MMTSKTSAMLCAIGIPLGLLTAPVSAQEEGSESEGVRILEEESNVERRAAAIDSEHFELGIYSGLLAIEDFGNETLHGIELSYHLPGSWFAQVNYGRAEAGQAAFESGGRRFLDDSDRDFQYWGLSAGYRVLQGRSFFGARHKYDSDIYALAGPERVSFAGNEEWGWNLGLSYRVVFTDWLTGSVDFREHIVPRDFIGDDKITLNTEFRLSINALF